MPSKSSKTKHAAVPKDGVTAVEGAVRTFSELYEDAKQRIISNVLAHAEKYPNSPFSGTPLTRLEKAMRAEYERLGVDISQEFRDTLPEIMKSFYDSAIVELAKDSASGIIGEIDKGRINYYLQDSFDSVAGATNRMAVTHIRELRRISANIFRRTSISGESRKQVSRELLREAMNIPGFQFIDKAGSKWQAKNYFEMLARTQLMEAGRESYQDGCVKAGCDIVRVSVSGHSCPKCARFENRLLSISGNTPGLPTVAEARTAGLFHPNCTHSLIAVPDYIVKTDYDEYGLPKSGYNSSK